MERHVEDGDHKQDQEGQGFQGVGQKGRRFPLGVMDFDDHHYRQYENQSDHDAYYDQQGVCQACLPEFEDVVHLEVK